MAQDTAREHTGDAHRPDRGRAAPDVVNRDLAAMIRFDTFLFSSAATVLITRAYLAATGYPQVGGHGELHVAHVLWGGLLLATGVIMMLVTLGSRAKLRAALIAGVGFGLFIDEVGKFLTKNVNYFFRPAVAIIYAVLVTTYLAGRELLRHRRITPARAKSMAVDAYLDQTLGDLTDNQRTLTIQLLDDVADRSDPMVGALRSALLAPRVPDRRSAADVITAVREATSRRFARLIRRRWFRGLMFTILIVQALDAVTEAIADLIPHDNISAGRGVTALGSVISTTIAGLLILVGLVVRRTGRVIAGLQIVQAGLMVNLLVSDLFKFASSQFGALLSFAVHVILILTVAAGITERRLQTATAEPAPA